MALLNGAGQASVILGGACLLGGDIGVIMTSTGTVSDFDRAGLFGLVIADDGALLPFNLRETPPCVASVLLDWRSRQIYEAGSRAHGSRG
jgi:hypothetical protein